jgi:hypothetical protein
MLRCRQGQAGCRHHAATKPKLAATATLPSEPSWPPWLRCPHCCCAAHCRRAAAAKLLPLLRCGQAATAAATTFVFIVVVVAFIVAVPVTVAAIAFSWLLFAVCAPAIAVAAGVFVATATMLPSYHPVDSFIEDIRFQKIKPISWPVEP